MVELRARSTLILICLNLASLTSGILIHAVGEHEG
jgi:hypothetical protein